MTHDEFHAAILPKVRGTWNLHNASLKHEAKLDFFTLLSSICGIVGQKGQANYSAANSFLDAFATYRKSLHLPACSVDLGVVEDVGYVNSRESLSKRLLAQGWQPIDEVLLHEIIYFSILQQQEKPVNTTTSDQLITGIPVPLPAESPAARDLRFSALRQGAWDDALEGGGASKIDDMTVLRHAFREKGVTEVDHAELLDLLMNQANRRLARSLGLSESLDPKRPLAGYGIDSLVGIELRNWIKGELGVNIAMLEIVGAKTLEALCGVILKRGLEISENPV
jgi:aryl carrier-like protein